MRVAAGAALGEIGDARELPVRQDAVRDAQTAHVGVLRRRHVEQPVVFPAKRIGRFGKLVVRRLLLQPRISIERMLVALDTLLLVELAAGGDGAVLRGDVLGIRPARRRRFGGSTRQAAPGARDLEA